MQYWAPRRFWRYPAWGVNRDRPRTPIRGTSRLVGAPQSGPATALRGTIERIPRSHDLGGSDGEDIPADGRRRTRGPADGEPTGRRQAHEGRLQHPDARRA